MPALFKNNATATIAATINNSTTTIVLAAGLGNLFPSPSGGSYFYGTLFDSANNYEIIKVTARSTDTLTVVRGQDNTTALSFNAGSGFAMRPTAAIFENLVQLDGAQTISGAKTFSSALTYGGVTLANSVTGTGSMVLSASPTFTGAPIAPTAAPGTNTTQIATTAFVAATIIPTGVIVMWSGSIASIPSGWLLCDGTSGTPNLRDRFVVGAGTTYAVAATGGTADAVVVSHTHTATSTDSGHTHNAITQTSGGSSPGAQYTNSFSGSVNTTSTAMIQTSNAVIATTVDSAGVSGTNQNLPPYYALAYIMKA